MATKKKATPKAPAKPFWSPEALAQIANQWIAGGHQPTPEMLNLPGVKYTPPAHTVVDPGTPEAPPTQPFLSPDQIQSLNQLFFDTGGQLAALAQNDVTAWANAAAQIGNPDNFNAADPGTDLSNAVNKQAMQAKVSATDAAIARGLFQSSIRDADLADVEATRQMRRNFFRDQYNSVIKTDAAQRQAIQQMIDRSVGAGYDPKNPQTLGGAYGQMGVQNALDNPGAPGTPPKTEDTPAHFDVIPPPAPAASAPAPNTGGAVSWATWNSWSEDMRNRYRTRHRNEWEKWRPR